MNLKDKIREILESDISDDYDNSIEAIGDLTEEYAAQKVNEENAELFKKFDKWCSDYIKIHEAIKIPFNSSDVSRVDGSTYILVPTAKYESFLYESDQIDWIDKECLHVDLDKFMIGFAKWMADVPGDDYENQLKEFKLKYAL